MKKLLSLLILLAMGIFTEIMSQSPEKDFVIVGVVSGDLNLIQIQMRYEGAPNVYFIRESSTSAAEQIANSLEGLKINDLHIFTRSNTNGILLSGQPVTIENVNESSVQFKRWRKSVSGKVIIHINSGVTSPEISKLIIRLEQLCELEFKVIQ
jgi:hypothetical protein